jgi:hypothetical protein
MNTIFYLIVQGTNVSIAWATAANVFNNSNAVNYANVDTPLSGIHMSVVRSQKRKRQRPHLPFLSRLIYTSDFRGQLSIKSAHSIEQNFLWLVTKRSSLMQN